MKIEMQKLTEIVREVKPFLFDKEEASHITAKGAKDYVTQVDLHVQEYMKRRLAEEWPEIQFMGEEGDNSSLDLEGAFWILDPVDGTTNLIHDYRCSAVSLGLCDHGEIICGVIYQPYTEEVFYAQKGEGAYLNGKQIHVTDVDTIGESLIAIGTTPYEREYAARNFALFQKIYMDCQDLRRSGSAAIDLAYVACGRHEAFFEMNLKPWDFAAGIIIIEEAGGSVTDFEQKRIIPWKNSNILSSNGKVGKLLAEKYMMNPQHGL